MATSVTPVADPLDAAIAAFNGEETTSDAGEQVSAPANPEDTSTVEEPEDVIDTPGEQTPAKGSSQKLQKLLEKYGNDEDKFADAIYEQWNSASRIHKELEDLKSLVVSQNAKPDEEVAALESADVQWIKEELTDLRNELGANANRKSEIIQAAAQFNEQIAELRGEARRADEFEKARLEGQIDRMIAKRESLAAEYKDIDKRNREISKEEKKLLRDFRQAESTLEQQRSQLSRQKEDQAAKRAETVDTYTKTFQEEIASYQLPQEQLAPMYHAVRRDIKEYLEMLVQRGNGFAPEQDMVDLTKRAVADYARVWKLARKTEAAQQTQQKLATTSKPPVKPVAQITQSVKPSKDKLPEGWSKMSAAKKASFAQERARLILGG